MSSVKFAVKQGFRPVAGKRLFAYTHSWLVLSGLAGGGSIARSTAVKIAGQTAVGYHISQGNFHAENGSISLTPAGMAKFGPTGRVQGIDANAANAFVSFMATGKNADTLGLQEFMIEKI